MFLNLTRTVVEITVEDKTNDIVLIIHIINLKYIKMCRLTAVERHLYVALS